MKYYSELIKRVKDIPNDIGEKLKSLNKVETSIGDLSELSTTDKSSIVNAINEVISTKNTVKCSMQVTIDSNEPAIGQTITVKNIADETIEQKVISSLYTEFELNYGIEYEITLDIKEGGFTLPKNKVIKPYKDIELIFDYETCKIYGIDIDETNSDPSTCVTYTDDAIGFTPLFCGGGTLDYGSWENTFVIQGNKPCLLKNGVRQYYLNSNDYTKKENGEASDITSGNDGDVMAEFKKCYYKLWKEGDIVKFRVSEVKVDDTWCCNVFLSEDGKSEEKDYMYISTYESYSLSSKMRSLSGKAPWVKHIIATARTQATANGSGYQQLTLSKWVFIAMLNTLVTKSLDHQTKIGQGRSKSSNTTAINTGTMNSKGQFWGDQTGTNGMKVFHIENFYGNIWTFIDGLIVASRVSKYKVSGPYNDSGSGYISGYNIPTSDGYISKINCNNDNGIIPSSASGSATTYYTDYIYQNSGTYVSLIGGYWIRNSYVGSFFLDVIATASDLGSHIGSRLSFS